MHDILPDYLITCARPYVQYITPALVVRYNASYLFSIHRFSCFHSSEQFDANNRGVDILFT